MVQRFFTFQCLAARTEHPVFVLFEFWCNEALDALQRLPALVVVRYLVCLQATDLGLATCWIGSFFPEKVRPILGIPEDTAIIELMALGYPADEGKQPDRKPIDEILCYDKWRF